MSSKWGCRVAAGCFTLVWTPRHRVRGAASLHPKKSLLHPVIGEFLDNIGVHRLRIVDIQVAFRNRAVAFLGKAATVERRRQSRVDLEGGVEISNCILVLAALQVDEAAAVQRA